jgi:hypothetical protein
MGKKNKIGGRECQRHCRKKLKQKGPQNFYFEARSLCIAQADLKLAILLPQPPECRNYTRTTICTTMLI